MTDFNLAECLDVIERATRGRGLAWASADAELVRKAEADIREARERIREEFQKLTLAHTHSHDCDTCKQMSKDYHWTIKCNEEAEARIAELEGELLERKELHEQMLKGSHYMLTQRDARIAELESQLQAKHPCDETCPACWGLAKEATEWQNKARELEERINEMVAEKKSAFQERLERIQAKIDKGGRKT